MQSFISLLCNDIRIRFIERRIPEYSGRRYLLYSFRKDRERWFRNKDLKDIACDRNRQVHVVPQLIASTPDEFRPIVRLFQENGYKEADINLGCPFPYAGPCA